MMTKHALLGTGLASTLILLPLAIAALTGGPDLSNQPLSLICLATLWLVGSAGLARGIGRTSGRA